MKRWEGEDFESYRARRAENAAVEKAHLKGRFANGEYADPAMHSLLTESASLDRAKGQAFILLNLIGAAGVGWVIGTIIYYVIGS